MMSGHTELPGRSSAGLSASLLLVILGLLIGPAHGIGISVEPSPTCINGTVFMNVNGISEAIRSFSWYKDVSSAPTQIVNYIPSASPPQTPGSSYIEGATAFPNATLSIPHVEGKHSGLYIVQVQTSALVQANVTLLVIACKDHPHLSPGAIAGICIAALVVVCGAVGGGVYYTKHKSNRPAGNTAPPSDANSYGNVMKQDH